MGFVGIMYEKGDIVHPSVKAALDAQCIDLSCLHRPAKHRSVFVITDADTDIGKTESCLLTLILFFRSGLPIGEVEINLVNPSLSLEPCKIDPCFSNRELSFLP